ncbi:MAG: Hsp20/alpha crystallin family protein [Candidatus Hodarchaeales archaeon]
MAIQLWSPFEETSRLEDELNRIFSIISGEEDLISTKRTYSPLTDIYETEKEYVLTINLPGIKKDNVSIEATPETIEIKAEREEENETKDHKVLHRERRALKYHRKISFNKPIDPNKAVTTLENGILEIRMPIVKPPEPVKLLLK